MEPQVRMRRAVILASRGTREQASRDLETTYAQLDDSPDLQWRMPILIGSAEICLLLGDRERAEEIIRSATQVAREGVPRAPPLRAADAVTITRCGAGEAFFDRFKESTDTARMVAARLVFTGDALEAAELYARMSPQEEAAARLFAAELLAEEGKTAEAEAQLQRALAFFRAVGATAVVSDAEKLLAAAS